MPPVQVCIAMNWNTNNENIQTNNPTIAELSHQQSREIQQHHNRISSTSNTYAQTRFGINIETTRIRQAMTDTAAKIASAAKVAAESAKVQLQKSPSYSDPSYIGPYAQANNSGIPGGSAGRFDSPCADFGLRESAFGDYDEFQTNNVNANTNSASSAPLLSNNYGMDVSLGDESMTNNNENQDKKFVLLETFRAKRDGWGAVANLDLFFTSLYNYYYHRGIVPIVGKGLVELISLFFTLWLSVFLFAYLDWSALWMCTDETSCKADLNAYIVDKVRLDDRVHFV